MALKEYVRRIFLLFHTAKFNLSIHGTEDGPHMWPKRLPSFFAFFYI